MGGGGTGSFGMEPGATATAAGELAGAAAGGPIGGLRDGARARAAGGRAAGPALRAALEAVAGVAEAALTSAVDDCEALGSAVRELRARAAAQEGRILAMQEALAGRAGEGARLRREVEGLRLELQLAREEAALAAERASAEREALAAEVGGLCVRCERAEAYASHIESAALGELGRLKSLRSSILRIDAERQRWSRDALRPLRTSIGELPPRPRRSARLATLLGSPLRASVDNSLLHSIRRGPDGAFPDEAGEPSHASLSPVEAGEGLSEGAGVGGQVEGDDLELEGTRRQTVQERLLDLNGHLSSAFRGLLNEGPSIMAEDAAGGGSPLGGPSFQLQGDGLFLPSGVLTPRPFSPHLARQGRSGRAPRQGGAPRGALFAEKEDSYFIGTPDGHDAGEPPRRPTPERSPFQQRRRGYEAPGLDAEPAAPGDEALATAAALAGGMPQPKRSSAESVEAADLFAAVKSSAEDWWGAIGWKGVGGAVRTSTGEDSLPSSQGTPAPRAPLGTISNTAPRLEGRRGLAPGKAAGTRSGPGARGDAEDVLAAAALLASPPPSPELR